MKKFILGIALVVTIIGLSFILLGETSAQLFGYTDVTQVVTDPLTFAYLGFLGIVVFLYYILPKKAQSKVILIGSLVFYLMSGVQYLVFIIGSTLITFLVARKMSDRIESINEEISQAKGVKAKKALRAEMNNGNKSILALAIIGTLGVMVVIKYTYFIMENINALLNTSLPLVSLLMPLGLSFYTFMLIAYLMDVYRGKYVAEKKFSRFLQFSTFFPHVSQGPISRYDELSAEQFSKSYSFSYESFCHGMQRILWGFFMKLVLADRLSFFVNGVYDQYESQSWLMLVLAALAFSIQIYVDFYSSMEIAIGSAQLFGIKLAENFMRPYFSKSMPEFWRRWHITLGTWFKDYVFYPIAISKNLMKFSRWSRDKFGATTSKILAAIPPIMGVWALTGLWHGAAWNFVCWGVYHGILIVLSTIFAEHVAKGLTRVGIRIESKGHKVVQMIKVFILCTIGRVFFVSDSLTEAFQIFGNIFTLQNSEKGIINLENIQLLTVDYWIIIFAIIILFTVSTIQEIKGSVRVQVDRLNLGLRWAIWIFLIFATIVFGIYGDGAPGEFIYEEF